MTYEVRIAFGVYPEVDHSVDIQESWLRVYREFVLLLRIYPHNDSRDMSASEAKKRAQPHHGEDEFRHVEPRSHLYGVV